MLYPWSPRADLSYLAKVESYFARVEYAVARVDS